MNKEWYSVNEVADILGESYKKIYNLLVSGELGHYRVGRSYRIRKADLEAYFARQDKRLHSILLSAADLPDALLLDTPEAAAVPIPPSPPAREPNERTAAQPASSPSSSAKWQRILADEPSLGAHTGKTPLAALENSGRAARQREAHYIANFRQLFRAGLAVAHPDTGEIVRLDDWSSVEQMEDDLLQLGQYLGLSVLRPEQQASYPNNARVLYWIEPNSLGGILRKYPKQGLVVECAVLSRQERFVDAGHDDERLSDAHVRHEVEERDRLAQRWSARLGAPIAYIFGLASTTGWDPASIAYVRTLGHSTNIITYLVDLVDLEVYSHDENPKSGDYLELFDLPLGERKLARVQQQIQDALLASRALRLGDLQAQLGCSLAMARAAVLQLASENADYRVFQEGNNLIIHRT